MSLLEGSAAAMTNQGDDRLGVLLDAARELAGEHELVRILDRVTSYAARIAGSRYAALSVCDADGRIEQFIHHGMDSLTARRLGRAPEGRGLLGALLIGDGPIRIDEIEQDARRGGFPSHHPPMQSFLGVPIRVAGRRFGNLYVTDKRDAASFDDEDERLVTTLASFAAAAIEAAMLIEAERDLANIQARSRAQSEMLGMVIDAQEAERARVARDLHDQIGQSLTSILLALRLVDVTLTGEPCDGAKARARTQEVRALVTQTLDEVRQLAFDLRPTVLDDIGLEAALRRLAQDHVRRHELPVLLRYDTYGDDVSLRPGLETVLYRVVQEALTNVVRHAPAATAWVSITVEPHGVRAHVADDGRGFDVNERTMTSLGLAGMVERARLAGGSLHIASAPGTGTEITLEVPR